MEKEALAQFDASKHFTELSDAERCEKLEESRQELRETLASTENKLRELTEGNKVTQWSSNLDRLISFRNDRRLGLFRWS